MRTALALLVCLGFTLNAHADEPSPPVRYALTEEAFRSEPRPAAPTIGNVRCGEPVGLIEANIGAPYARVVIADGRSGYLPVQSIGADANPVCSQPLLDGAREIAIRAVIDALSEELRLRGQIYDGNCRCPGDLASNGSRCGDRSAFTRLGGVDPRNCL
jgi:hypothetical protein